MLRKILRKVVPKPLKLFIGSLLSIRRPMRLSLRLSARQNKMIPLAQRLRDIAPDLSEQYGEEWKRVYDSFWELKVRMQHAFQCGLMLEAIDVISSEREIYTVVDIGDSAGTHMLYLKELTKDRFTVDTISVNLDPLAIEKIKKRGQRAILCRAEELMLDNDVDLFVSFEMVEHLHNPALFFRQLATKSSCRYMVVTVPYVKRSRVALRSSKSGMENIHALNEHIFELCPDDWKALILHGGWRTIYEKIYYQYPRRIPFVSLYLRRLWRKHDFEGFWGVILERDLTISNRYLDWEE